MENTDLVRQGSKHRGNSTPVNSEIQCYWIKLFQSGFDRTFIISCIRSVNSNIRSAHSKIYSSTQCRLSDYNENLSNAITLTYSLRKILLNVWLMICVWTEYAYDATTTTTTLHTLKKSWLAIYLINYRQSTGILKSWLFCSVRMVYSGSLYTLCPDLALCT